MDAETTTFAVAEASPDAPIRCHLQNQMFAALGDVRFRRASGDGMPVMALQFGEHEAQVPLHAVKREFAIEADTPDDRMLDLIGSSLEYVPSLRPGDSLPAEIRTGDASWRADPCHGRVAAARLRLNFVAWLSPTSRWTRAAHDDTSLLRLADDPALWQEVQAVAVPAARQLGLPDASQVLLRLEDLAFELSFIEALRSRLLLPIAELCRRLVSIRHSRQRGPVAFDTLLQVHRLSVAAYRQVSNRFEDVDGQTRDVSLLLRNVDSQRVFIRSNRDWLYRNQRDWTPLLELWAIADEDDLSRSLAATYRFLAPRAMNTRQWVDRHDRRVCGASARMTW